MEALKGEPLLRMKATGELFIVKTTLLQCGCPAPQCPEAGWLHMHIPNQCMIWWREIGWRLMGWHGSAANVDSGTVKEKISQFRRNFRRKNKSTSEGTLQYDLSQKSDHSKSQISDGINQHRCQLCHAEGVLVHHLHQSKTCLNAYLQQHLLNRAHIYRGKTRLALFDLGLLCRFCPNPDCEGSLGSEGLKQHLQGACLLFFQTEGTLLFKWSQNLTVAAIQEKLKNRKSDLKKFVGHEQGVGAYRKDLASVLKFVCHKCSIQGPLLESEVHKIWGAGRSMTTNAPLWECTKCRGGDEVHQEMVMLAVQRVMKLGSSTECDDTLTKIVVEDQDEKQRVVFIPACLLLDHEAQVVTDNDEELNPNSTTVLVPKNPEALNQIEDEATERANNNKVSLARVGEFFGRRNFHAPVTDTLSVFYRLKLAQIRIERLSMLSNMQGTSKGKITSRDPNFAELKDRHPHFAETQKFCLTNTCSWSAAAHKKRSEESAARACVNGQVKIKVEVTLVKSLAVDSPLLQDIIYGISASSHNPPSLISVAPTVLNFLKAKLSLLVKHIIAPTYTNWDLELRFAEQEWTVVMVGYLYCQEFEELNRNISRCEISSREYTKEVRRHPTILPTTALSAGRIMEEYSISQDRAQEIAGLAKRHQAEGEPQPVSLITMHTPKGLNVTEKEAFLRGRALQLGLSQRSELDCTEAIVDIMGTLRREGVGGVTFEQEDGMLIAEELSYFLLNQREDVKEDLLLYHILIWKTSGEGMFTMKRNPGECTAAPYIPALLEASGMKMSAEICAHGDHLMPEERGVSEEVKSFISSSKDAEEVSFLEDWQEVSCLEFLNGTLPAEKLDQAKGPTSQPIIPVVSTKDRKLTWRGAVDSDNHNGETIFESAERRLYVRTVSDIRILYEARPRSMAGMPLGQFSSQYRLLKPSGHGYEKAKSGINEDTCVGSDSECLVAGTSTAAPETIMLTNGKLMKRRQDVIAVPNLLFSGCISKHGNQLMWSPWQKLEEVTGIQDENETKDQKKVRLEIFPFSVFPIAEEENTHSEL